MKVRAYIRVAKETTRYGGSKSRIDAATKANEEPIFKPAQYNKAKEFLPTVGFAIDLDIPDTLFDKASIVIASINVGTKEAKILSEVPVVTPVK